MPRVLGQRQVLLDWLLLLRPIVWSSTPLPMAQDSQNRPNRRRVTQRDLDEESAERWAWKDWLRYCDQRYPPVKPSPEWLMELPKKVSGQPPSKSAGQQD